MPSIIKNVKVHFFNGFAMEIRPSHLKFGELLDYANAFVVPYYQRNYSWTKSDQVKQLWQDIDLEYSTDEGHFMGAVYFVPQGDDPNSKEMVILDGQQRLLTFALILVALRRSFDLSNHSDKSIHIGTINESLYKIPRGQTQKITKILANMADRNFFQSLILPPGPGTVPQQPTRKSHKLIQEAYDYSLLQIQKNVVAIGEQYLTKLYSMIVEKFEFLAVRIDTIENAQRVFETLNDRGLDLSQADLIKNFILGFYSAPNQQATLIQRICDWDNSIQFVENDVTGFLKHYLSSKNGLTRKDQIFKTIKNEVNSQSSADRFIVNIMTEAEIYYYLRNPDINYWQDEEIVDLLVELKYLGVTQVYILLLSAYARLMPTNPDDFKRLIRLLINFTFRFSTIGDLSPSPLEDDYSELAKNIRVGNKGVSDIIVRLNQLSPNDDIFVQFFIAKDYPSSLARHILITANNWLIKKMCEDSPETIIITNEREINLEHIIPKTLNQKWQDHLITAELDHQKVLNRIGNLAIIKGKWNSRMGNKFFDEKKEFYRNSQLPLTSVLEVYPNWGREEILSRCIETSEIAKRIWTLNF